MQHEETRPGPTMALILANGIVAAIGQLNAAEWHAVAQAKGVTNRHRIFLERISEIASTLQGSEPFLTDVDFEAVRQANSA